jgi:hypothetical protein
MTTSPQAKKKLQIIHSRLMLRRYSAERAAESTKNTTHLPQKASRFGRNKRYMIHTLSGEWLRLERHREDRGFWFAVQDSVQTVTSHQLFVRALFPYDALIQHDDAINPFKRRYPVRDEKHRVTAELPSEILKD